MRSYMARVLRRARHATPVDVRRRSGPTPVPTPRTARSLGARNPEVPFAPSPALPHVAPALSAIGDVPVTPADPGLTRGSPSAPHAPASQPTDATSGEASPTSAVPLPAAAPRSVATTSLASPPAERLTREFPEAQPAAESERLVVTADPASRVVGEPWRGINDSQHPQERQEATSSAQESPAGEGDESPHLPFPAGAVEVRWQWPAAAAALPAESRAQLEREVVRVVRERWREAPPRVAARTATPVQLDVRIEQLTVRVEAPPPVPPAPPREAAPPTGRGGAAATGFSSFQLQRSLSGF